MEEVDALASRVGIIAGKMLAVGTPASLKNRFATYEVHIPADYRDAMLDILHAQEFGSAKASGDTSTRISVPGVGEDQVGRLLGVMVIAKQELGDVEMTLHE